MKTNHFYHYASKKRYDVRYFDIIVSSKQLKELFLDRCNAFDVDPERVAIEAGMPITQLWNGWLNNRDSICTKQLDQEMVLTVLRLVGINVRLTVFHSDIEEVDLEWIRNKSKDEQKLRVRQAKKHLKRQ